jgi:hypothetical protein
MVWESAIGSVIEVAISLAGFSGIVAAVGRRGAGHWSKGDQLLLKILLTSSGAVLFFAFLPFTMIDAIEPFTVWRVLSGLLATWLLGIGIYRSRQGSAAGFRGRFGLRNPYYLIPTIAIVFMLAVNAIWLGSSSLYLVGLLWITAIPFSTFVSPLLNSWKQPSESMPPAS